MWFGRWREEVLRLFREAIMETFSRTALVFISYDSHYLIMHIPPSIENCTTRTERFMLEPEHPGISSRTPTLFVIYPTIYSMAPYPDVSMIFGVQILEPGVERYR